MDKISIKKTRKPEQNKLPQEHVQSDKDFNTLSVPKRDMIMPEEFNTVSDPKIGNETHSQAVTGHSIGWH